MTTNNKSANIGARLDCLPNSGWHVKMWLVTAFALLVCWSNGIGGAVSPNIYVLYIFRLIQGFGLGALLIVLFAGFTEYVPGKNRGVWSSRNSFIGNWAHPLCNGIALLIVSTGISYNMNWRVQ